MMNERGLSVSLAMLSSWLARFFGSRTDIAVLITHLLSFMYYIVCRNVYYVKYTLKSNESVEKPDFDKTISYLFQTRLFYDKILRLFLPF